MLSKEELKGTYIRYRPDITEEVFNRVIQRLKNLNYTENHDQHASYERFKALQYLAIHNCAGSEEYDFGTFSGVSRYREEIQISDIIGKPDWWENLKKGDYVVCTSTEGVGYKFNCIYKIKSFKGFKSDLDSIIFTEVDSNGITNNGWNVRQFRLATSDEILMYKDADKPVDVTTYKMKEKEFVLPEKWAIRVTNENKSVISKWRTLGEALIGSYCHNKVNNSAVIGYATSQIIKEYTEISFDQFKKYVLKEKEITADELLKTAKERYPVGTIFNSPHNSGIGYELNQEVEIAEFKYNFDNMVTVKKTSKNYAGIVYRDGEWAEIVKKPIKIGRGVLDAVDKVSTPIKPEKYSDYVGKWIREDKYPNYLMYIGTDEYYGFGTSGQWLHLKGKFINPYGYTIATDEEVEEKLLEYARKMYPIGTKYKSLIIIGEVNTIGYMDELEVRGCNVCTQNGYYVLRLGEWAKIVSSVESKPTNEPTIYGYTIGSDPVVDSGKRPNSWKILTRSDSEAIRDYRTYPLTHSESCNSYTTVFPKVGPLDYLGLPTYRGLLGWGTSPQKKKTAKLKISRNKKKRITNKKVKVSNKHLIIINK